MIKQLMEDTSKSYNCIAFKKRKSFGMKKNQLILISNNNRNISLHTKN